ncbi:MAG: ABC transporter ATP-binding protein [Bdellovibrionaceae bacterium]|nr:ABC transporter ATP-binding protein [Pseudobdellovibrionaceae bacterium]MBX3033131.1 ABC transporter ATP-binding protein [Pseudobdellovibrionaceae bacterium]
MIEVSHVEFTYPSGRAPVLRLPEFRVEKGERIFLFGPSGTGKTTFLEIMAGVLRPQKGSVRILGQDLGALSPAGRDRFRADHIGYIFQSFNLIPYLNVRENIELPLHFGSRPGKNQLDHLVKSLGIGDLLARPVTELSVGQQQRVAVARALIGSPELILADEPTSALDMDHRERFLKLLFDLAGESQTTVVFVSHDRSIQKLFTRAVSLADLQAVTA